jgi:hypothetical protein
VAKALEKDRARRYASAGELAADIRRHLANEPILARPPSALYQLRKFARRHKALAGGMAGGFAALLGGTIVSVLFALRAEESARVAANKERLASYQAYRARVAAAVAALAYHDVIDAARHLDAAPEELRDWEWHPLHGRLDDSAAVFPAAAGESLRLLRGPEGARIAASTGTRLRLLDAGGHQLLARSFEPGRTWLHIDLQSRHGLRLLEAGGDTVQLLDEGAG